MEIYQHKGFKKVEDFVQKLPVNVLQQLVKLMPEAEQFLKMN
jgi:hypothetical protein